MWWYSTHWFQRYEQGQTKMTSNSFSFMGYGTQKWQSFLQQFFSFISCILFWLKNWSCKNIVQPQEMIAMFCGEGWGSYEMWSWNWGDARRATHRTFIASSNRRKWGARKCYVLRRASLNHRSLTHSYPHKRSDMTVVVQVPRRTWENAGWPCPPLPQPVY